MCFFVVLHGFKLLSGKKSTGSNCSFEASNFVFYVVWNRCGFVFYYKLPYLSIEFFPLDYFHKNSIQGLIQEQLFSR